MADEATTLSPIDGAFPWRATLAAALIAGSLACVLGYLANYEPLGSGSGSVGLLGIEHRPTKTYFQTDEILITGEAGAFQTYLPLHNEGPLGVTVIGMRPTSRWMETPVRFEGLLVTPKNNISAPGRAFRPFALAPGETRQLLIESRFLGCLPGGTDVGPDGETLTIDDGGAWGFDRVDIEFRIFGARQVQSVQLPAHLIVDCDRKAS